MKTKTLTKKLQFGELPNVITQYKKLCNQIRVYEDKQELVRTKISHLYLDLNKIRVAEYMSLFDNFDIQYNDQTIYRVTKVYEDQHKHICVTLFGYNFEANKSSLSHDIPIRQLFHQLLGQGQLIPKAELTSN